ncbi:MAG: SpoIIE family protein phosphatase [Nitrospirae bacterium]|nr:SpoIIE family protein phosphatase [Nitrospirota bacterium]
MRINLRSKFVIAISLLMVAVFVAAAWLFIQEKKTEIADDIYHNTLAFAKLTAAEVTENYDLYLAQSGFVYFNREVRSLFEKNDDISGLKVVSYTGELLYDSFLDKDKKYEGGVRSVDDLMVEQIKSENLSLKMLDGEVVYLKTDKSGGVRFVDKYEREVEPLEIGALIDYMVVSATEKYSVVYVLDYHNLDERVAIMMRRIIYLAMFGVMLGVLMSLFLSSKITKPVAKLVEGAEKIATGDFKTRVEIETRDEIGFLGDAFNGMAKDLELSVEAKLYKERVTRELELAAQIQNQIIPAKDQIPQMKGLEIASELISAAEIGGDMYDFMKVEEDRLLMYLGDVTGHGVPAGIVSSISSALFYGYSGLEDLKKIIVNVNRVLKAKTMSNMFMTLCLMEWNDTANSFKYISAGHEQIIHYTSKTKDASLTPAGGVALGMTLDISKLVKIEDVVFEPGDYLVIYSDGIPEAWKNEKENYGMERFEAFVKQAGAVAKNAEELKTMILDDVKKFTAGFEQKDDITLIVLKRV